MGNSMKKEVFECIVTFPKEIYFKLDRINVSKDHALIYFNPPKNNLKFDRITLTLNNSGKDHFYIEENIELNKNLSLFKIKNQEYLQKTIDVEDSSIIVRMNKSQKIRHILLIIPGNKLFEIT
tara:strand:- start:84 stop:452 length:369 start_codon:yes stop_codon:yes gene_type:complete